MNAQNLEVITNVVSTHYKDDSYHSGHAWTIASVWNGEVLETVHVGCCCSKNRPVEMIAGEEKAAYEAWKAAQDLFRAQYEAAQEEDKLLTSPQKGETVRIRVKGKGREVKNAGLHAKFVKFGMGDYGAWAMLVADNGEVVFTKPEYLEIENVKFDAWEPAFYGDF